MNEPYQLSELNEDGTRIMTVRGVEFKISPQSMTDVGWEAKLQAKANAWGSSLPEVPVPPANP